MNPTWWILIGFGIYILFSIIWMKRAKEVKSDKELTQRHFYNQPIRNYDNHKKLNK